MQMLNRYFSPFALLLILSAVYCSDPEPSAYHISLGILLVASLVNWWLAANTYRFIRWGRIMRHLQVWLNFLWAVPLFYLLVPFWAPMWLLFVMPSATAALYMTRLQTAGVAVVSAGTMLAIFYRNGAFAALTSGGMAIVQASFIVIFALFVHALAQNALRLRDIGQI
jgi:hypothetical protein